VGNYIRECIESVVNQTLKEIEILCVDAGSTDDTLEILQEYAAKDDRIHIIHSDKKSYGYQMNLGLKAAQGEYIGIVETDDFASLNMCEVLYLKAKKSSAQVVKANYYTYISKPQKKNEFVEVLAGLPYEQLFSAQEHREVLFRTASIWAGIYERKFLMENHIDFLETPGASYQDTAFVMKAWICAERIYLVRDAFLHYRIDNENSSVKSGAKVYCVCDEFASVHEFLKSRPDKNKTFNEAVWAWKAEIYRWNYFRLSDGFRYSFSCRIRDEFLQGDLEGSLNEALASPDAWKIIRQILDDPESFYRENRGPEVISAQNALYELQEVRASLSFRIGRFVTFIPRKIRGGVRCWRENGLRYTLYRIKEKTKCFMGREQ
jgi:glycosyltransferase involved in cell wall biosynthesis